MTDLGRRQQTPLAWEFRPDRSFEQAGGDRGITDFCRKGPITPCRAKLPCLSGPWKPSADDILGPRLLECGARGVALGDLGISGFLSSDILGHVGI